MSTEIAETKGHLSTPEIGTKIVPEKMVVFETGATRCAQVAGERKFPARYELISTIGLNCLACAMTSKMYPSVSEGPAGIMRYLLGTLNVYRSERRKNSEFDLLGLSARAIFDLIEIEENPADEPRPRVYGDSVARFDLISPYGLRALAETYGEGSIKYGDNNWLKGMSEKIILQHLLAHINQYRLGDRSEDHLGHAAWGVFALMHFREVLPVHMDLFAGVPDGQRGR